MVIEQWQSYLQEVTNLFSHGYFYFCPVKYPQDKINKWPRIDQKLIAKYSANQDKDRKYRNKQKGLANYMLVRHADQCLLLRTEGREIEVHRSRSLAGCQSRTLLLPVRIDHPEDTPRQRQNRCAPRKEMLSRYKRQSGISRSPGTFSQRINCAHL